MIPLLILAAGLLAQGVAKDKSIKAQKKVLRQEQERQDQYRGQADHQLQTERDAYDATARTNQDRAAEEKMRATADNTSNDAISLFEGSHGGSNGDRATADAVRSRAGQRGAAFAGLNGHRVGQDERRRLGLDVGANIAGIRQRSQRSLGLLPDHLERASETGRDLNMVGGLMTSYGMGGTGSMLTGLAQDRADQESKVSRYQEPRRYPTSAPGAGDLWGEQDPYYQPA